MLLKLREVEESCKLATCIVASMALERPRFRAADDDGDGNLSHEEFVEAMSLPSVQGFLTSLDVSIRDCRPLFDILDDGDGLITIAEFCRGLMQLKGQARALDIVVLQRENAKLMKECQEIQRRVGAISDFVRSAR